MNKLSSHTLLLQVCCLLFCCRHSSTQNVLNTSVYDFPGPVPSGSAESCVSVYTHVAGLTCEGIQSSDPRIVLQRCYVKAGDTHGVIAFYVNTTNLEKQQVFRVRITGPNTVAARHFVLRTQRGVRAVQRLHQRRLPRRNLAPVRELLLQFVPPCLEAPDPSGRTQLFYSGHAPRFGRPPTVWASLAG